MIEFLNDLKTSKKRSYLIFGISIGLSFLLAYFGFVTQQRTIDALQLKLDKTQSQIALSVDESRAQIPILKQEINDFFRILNRKLDSSILSYDMSKSDFKCRGYNFYNFALLGLDDKTMEFVKVENPYGNTRRAMEETCNFQDLDFLAETAKGTFWYVANCDSALCQDIS